MTRTCFSISGSDRPGLLRDLAGCFAEAGANIEGINYTAGKDALLHIDVAGDFDSWMLGEALRAVQGVNSVAAAPAASAIFGKRVIVIGGGAQVAQVVLGAVSEADRHNIRGEHISVDTIPLVGETKLAEAVLAVARLPRASILVLAGSLMGGQVADAVRQLRAEFHVPVISLNMAGSVTEAADLVVSDPVQAGVMAVMAIANTASFDLNRVRGRRF